MAIDYAESFITKLVNNLARNSKFIFENLNHNETVYQKDEENFIDSLSHSMAKELNEQEEDIGYDLK